MDLLWCYTRISCSLIQWNSERAKITIPLTQLLYPIPSPSTGWVNWPFNVFHVNNLNWQSFFPCHNIHVYSLPISYIYLPYSWIFDFINAFDIMHLCWNKDDILDQAAQRNVYHWSVTLKMISSPPLMSMRLLR